MTVELKIKPVERSSFDAEAGVVSNLRTQRVVENVFWCDGDREGMAATGAVAAVLGLSGSAAGMAMMSAEEMREPVFRVEFELGDLPVKGLLWNWPFKVQ